MASSQLYEDAPNIVFITGDGEGWGFDTELESWTIRVCPGIIEMCGDEIDGLKGKLLHFTSSFISTRNKENN
jgi:hypothetical protein